MRYVLLTLLFTLSVAAQSDLIKPRPYIKTEDINKWKSVAISADTPPTMWFFRTVHRVGNDAEVWLKVVHPKPITGRGHAPVIYSLDFTIFHCGQGRRTIETSIGYDAKGNIAIKAEPGAFGMNQREPIGPDSVNEELYNFFCS